MCRFIVHIVKRVEEEERILLQKKWKVSQFNLFFDYVELKNYMMNKTKFT